MSAGRVRIGAFTLCVAVMGWPARAAHAAGDEPKSYIDAKVENSIERSLKWLAKQQRRDGSWGQSNVVGTTSIALMAFVANGHLPGRGEFGEKVEKGATWLLKQADQYTGYIGSSMYEHGYATLVLGELFGEWKNEKLQDVLERGVGLIVKSQNRTGGWRYSPTSQDMDLSVSSAVIQAIRASREAYIDIPKKTIENALKAVRSCSSPQGTFGYTPGGGDMSAQKFGLGVASLLSLGGYEDRLVKKAVDHLRRSGGLQGIAASPYHAYYTALGLYQAGGSAWDELYPKLQKAVMRMQAKDGSFPGGMYGGGDGEVNVGFCTIILALPKGYIPLFQR